MGKRYIIKGNINQVNVQGDNNIEVMPQTDEPKQSDNQEKDSSTSKRQLWGFDKYTALLFKIFIGAILFFVVAACLNKWLKFGLSDDSVVLVFVGIAATFVVVSNYAQVQEIKREFGSKVEDIEKTFPFLESKYKIITRAMSEHQRGLLFLDFKDKSIALSCYMRSLELLNLVHDNEITSIVISSIDGLKQVDEMYKNVDDDRIEISQRDKIMYVEILHNCNHSLSGDLITWINGLPESMIKNIVDELANNGTIN
jgi:hypothetical protein